MTLVPETDLNFILGKVRSIFFFTSFQFYWRFKNGFCKLPYLNISNQVEIENFFYRSEVIIWYPKVNKML